LGILHIGYCTGTKERSVKHGKEQQNRQKQEEEEEEGGIHRTQNKEQSAEYTLLACLLSCICILQNCKTLNEHNSASFFGGQNFHKRSLKARYGAISMLRLKC